MNVYHLVAFAVVQAVVSDKVFKSVPVTVKTYENDTVLLPCYIDETESKLRVRWYKNQELLGDSADPNQLLPARTRMHANYSLQVDRLQASDTADYTCEVVRPAPMGPIRQTHSIEVQYSPMVRTIPEDGFLEVKKGEYVDIGCDVTGTPEPIVDWRKNGEPLALLEHRSRIRFKAEHRLLAGVYECTANNGVGDPVRAAIRVVIHDAPVVTAERTFVHTAIGLRAALSARVEFAAPPPRTAWYTDGRPVNTHDDRIVQMTQGDVHQLIFRSVRLSDFGNYTFRAQNKLGMADVSFKLTEYNLWLRPYFGRTSDSDGFTTESSTNLWRKVVVPGDSSDGVPNGASFKVDSALNKATSTSFTLIWEVDSYSTIIEYNLWLRPYFGRTSDSDGFTTESSTNLWRKVVVPGDSSDGPIHSAKYTVTGLTPSTVYEAIVTSRNRFGWSKQSAILHFATEPGTGRRPSTSDYSDITPLLEEPESFSEPEAYNITLAQILEQEKSSGARETPSWAAILILLFGAVGRISLVPKLRNIKCVLF